MTQNAAQADFPPSRLAVLPAEYQKGNMKKEASSNV
jgi:hypothetical protein